MDSALRDALDSTDDFAYAQQIRGLNEETVRTISAHLEEPQRMLEHRLASLEQFFNMSLPTW